MRGKGALFDLSSLESMSRQRGAWPSPVFHWCPWRSRGAWSSSIFHWCPWRSKGAWYSSSLMSMKRAEVDCSSSVEFWCSLIDRIHQKMAQMHPILNDLLVKVRIIAVSHHQYHELQSFCRAWRIFELLSSMSCCRVLSARIWRMFFNFFRAGP